MRLLCLIHERAKTEAVITCSVIIIMGNKLKCLRQCMDKTVANDNL